MWIEKSSKLVQKLPKSAQICRKLGKIEPKSIEEVHKLPRISYSRQKRYTYSQIPTAGPQTYWAPRAQVPEQFPALVHLLVQRMYDMRSPSQIKVVMILAQVGVPVETGVHPSRDPPLVGS